MIVHYAQGGLGNQLFNYAAARSLADRVGTDLVIDAESYRGQWNPDANRPFLLNHFPTRARFRNIGNEHSRKPIWRRILRRFNEDCFSTLIERAPNDLGYFKGFESLGSRTILKGHYVDYRFFSWNAVRVSEDLKLAESDLEFDDRGNRILAEIRAANCAISVHVRRGDLLDKRNQWLLLDRVENYYSNAINTMKERHVGASYFVFSDDPGWCARHFADWPLDLTVVESGSNPIQDILTDFFLMSICKHNVIANSAFSWWAAWLNRNPMKMVVAPYIYDNKRIIPINQIIPPEWVKISW